MAVVGQIEGSVARSGPCRPAWFVCGARGPCAAGGAANVCSVWKKKQQQGYGHVRFRHPWAAGERTLLHAAGRHADRVQFRAGHERFRGRGHPARHRPRVAGLRGHGRQSGVAVRHPSDVAGVFLAGNILCALAPNYAVLPHYSHMAKVGFLPQFRMRAGNGCLSALRLRTIPGR